MVVQFEADTDSSALIGARRLRDTTLKLSDTPVRYGPGCFGLLDDDFGPRGRTEKNLMHFLGFGRSTPRPCLSTCRGKVFTQ